MGALFQSTRPRGARLVSESQVPDNLVSIHAPARGATFHALTYSAKRSFNPRARAGRDKTLCGGA